MRTPLYRKEYSGGVWSEGVKYLDLLSQVRKTFDCGASLLPQNPDAVISMAENEKWVACRLTKEKFCIVMLAKV